jgi:arylsulfatase A-like enzyme
MLRTTLTLALCAFTSAQAQEPNVILVMADDLGYGDLSCQGHPHLHTPNLDSLANDGIRFTRFHAAAPVCSPTRASCLTGRHPYRSDIRGANAGHLGDDEVTLQRLMLAAGYRTGHFGKWHLGTLTTTIKESNRGGKKHAAHFAPPWQRDFQTCFSTEAKVPTFDPMHVPNTTKAYGTHYWNEAGEIVTDNLKGDDSRIIMDRVVPFVRNCVEQSDPFLAVVWLHAPHLPVLASDDDRKRYSQFPEQTQHYYGCITALDRQIGRLRTALEDLAIADNTIIWFCSDNGPEGKRGKAPGSAGELRGRKRSLFEGGTRVPAILSWPNRIPKAILMKGLACTSDMLPTLAGWLHLKLPEDLTLDGVDLRHSIEATAKGQIINRLRPIGFESARLSTWTDNQFKLVAHLSKAPPKFREIIRLELFDLKSDPTESNDVAAEHSDVVAKMQADLKEWRQAIRKRP